MGHPVQAVDDKTFAQHMVFKIDQSQYSALKRVIEMCYKNAGNRYRDISYLVVDLRIDETGSLCIGNQNKLLAGSDKFSTKQFNKLLDDLLKKDGIIRYHDAYIYANQAIENLSNQYTSLFCQRFRYVFIDEYQDCDYLQRLALNKLFDPSKCAVLHIGDPDQSIYNSDVRKQEDWVPSVGYLPIALSSRYGQQIADVISPLRKDQQKIESALPNEGLKPTLIIFDENTIGDVLPTFVSLLIKNGLNDPKGIYKAVGFVKNPQLSGKKIGSYWDGFDGTSMIRDESKYWGIVDDICLQLQKGNLYRAEFSVRKLICRIFYYNRITNLNSKKSKKKFTVWSLQERLKKDYWDTYTDFLLRLSKLGDYQRCPVNSIIHELIDTLLKGTIKEGKSAYDFLPQYFMEESAIKKDAQVSINTYIDPVSGINVKFDTVHGVKGETHDATLYLETETHNASDVGQVLCYYGAGKPSKSSDYYRKIVYVGMSRPRKFLCVAIQDSTYQKSQNIFDSWDKVDIRKLSNEN